MHRTQANGFETVGPKTLFQDTQPLGTLAEADNFNAMQEEIAQAVEAAGFTLNTQVVDSAAGTFNGARQLADAIASLDATFIRKTVIGRVSEQGGPNFVDITLTYMRHTLSKMTTIHIPAITGLIASVTPFSFRINVVAGTGLPNEAMIGFFPTFSIWAKESSPGGLALYPITADQTNGRYSITKGLAGATMPNGSYDFAPVTLVGFAP